MCRLYLPAACTIRPIVAVILGFGRLERFAVDLPLSASVFQKIYKDALKKHVWPTFEKHTNLKEERNMPVLCVCLKFGLPKAWTQNHKPKSVQWLNEEISCDWREESSSLLLIGILRLLLMFYKWNFNWKNRLRSLDWSVKLSFKAYRTEPNRLS